VVPQDAAFTVYDLGLGIAANALASIERRLNLGSAGDGPTSARRLRIISFENDLSGLELMLRSDAAFPLFARFRPAVETLIREGSWRDSLGQIEWQLRPGDFLSDRLEGLPPPEALFFDFYSPKATPALWGLGSFQKLRVKAGDLPCTLTTYSAATRIRSALLLAGFFVGYGDATSAKQETTVAATRLEDLRRPLEADWFEKFNRSARAMPEDLPTEDWESARHGVLGSPQGQRWALRL
jgi:queuine tRNA-ribosyltransferase